MTDRKEHHRDRMLASYGASVSRWPEGRLSGLMGLAFSADFRRAWREARALDQAIVSAAVPLKDSARFESRLLAAMGFAESAPKTLLPTGFHGGWKAAAAVACLCLGIALGGAFGEVALDEGAYAVITDEDWTDIETDGFLLLEDAG